MRQNLAGDPDNAVPMMVVQGVRENFLPHPKAGVLAVRLARRLRQRQRDFRNPL